MIKKNISVGGAWAVKCLKKCPKLNDKKPTSFDLLQHVADDGSTIVYIDNISPSESKSLRESLKKIGSVKNFLPLLNKVNRLYPVSLKLLHYKVLPAVRFIFVSSSCLSNLIPLTMLTGLEFGTAFWKNHLVTSSTGRKHCPAAPRHSVSLRSSKINYSITVLQVI